MPKLRHIAGGGQTERGVGDLRHETTPIGKISPMRHELLNGNIS